MHGRCGDANLGLFAIASNIVCARLHNGVSFADNQPAENLNP